MELEIINIVNNLIKIVHKKTNMINIKSKKCISKNCNTRPVYNYEGEKQALYCNLHKKPNMINIKDKRCIYDNCDTLPVYNYKGEKQLLYCNLHKKPNMIDIKSKRCINDDCDIRANYNYKGEKQVLYCNLHKKPNMINIKDKRCIYDNCDTLPVYNYKGEKQVLYCNLHKKPNMIDIKSKRCINDDCDIRANYNYKGEKQVLYCNLHKKPNMIDIKSKRCLSCNLYIVKKKNEYLCDNCYRFKYPNNKKFKNIKQKEVFITNKFKEEYPDIDLVYDKIISCQSCNKRRPDIFIDLFNYSIIIEIDENQHKNYECENKRLMEIFHSLGNRPLVVIRFNPDKYKENGKTIKGIFQFNKNGIIKETKSFYERFNELKKHFDYYLKNKPTKDLEIINLFYET